jgi:hypothetical protein
MLMNFFYLFFNNIKGNVTFKIINEFEINHY